jgi:hypothetical protein
MPELKFGDQLANAVSQIRHRNLVKYAVCSTPCEQIPSATGLRQPSPLLLGFAALAGEAPQATAVDPHSVRSIERATADAAAFTGSLGQSRGAILPANRRGGLTEKR